MANPFKNFNVYNVKWQDGMNSWDEIREDILGMESEFETHSFEAKDPSGSSYSHLGFAHVSNENVYLLDLNGAGVMMAIQINERVLPGKVLKESIKERVSALYESTGKPVNKKEYAQIRDEVEFDMLPKAFVRLTTVYAVITPESQLLIFAPVGKKSQSVADTIFNFFNTFVTFDISPLSVERSVVSYLNGVARCGLDEDAIFYPRNEGLFKGAEKRTVRVKDRDIGAHEIQALLKSDYDVHELGLDWIEVGEVDALMSFRFDDKLCFRGCVIGNTDDGDNEETGADKHTAFFSIAWLCVTTYRRLVAAISTELSGSDPTTTEDEEDF